MRWETLNAYVDGELDAGERRAVAEAARNDPAVAARIATLSRLKGTVRDAAPSEPRRVASGWRSPRAGWVCAALALSLGGALLIPAAQFPQADPALAAFAAWTGGPAGRVPAQDLGPPESAVPDLRAAGFALVHLAPAAGRGGRLAGYEGPHGCRLALWIGPATGPAGADGGRAPARVARWSADGRRFVALSDGLEAERFARIVALLEVLVRPQDPDHIRLAMAGAAGLADRPCAG